MIVLTMIVKNEAKVIERCLASVKPFVGAYCIVDTGSTDGTQEIVRDVMRGVPGDLHECRWVNFGYNRTEALDLAHWMGDYHLVIDADEVLEPGFEMPALTADVYSLLVHYESLTYWRPAIFRTDKPFRYEGVVHEYLDCAELCRGELLEGLVCRSYSTGNRGADRFERDALILKKALETEPNNSRYVFYLAQSLRDAGQFEQALEQYLARSEMAGRAEERWLALYEAGRLRVRLGHRSADIVAAFMRAYEARPQRIEPLYELARLFNDCEQWEWAKEMAERGLDRPVPLGEQLFLDRSIYERGMREEWERARLKSSPTPQDDPAHALGARGQATPGEYPLV